MSKIEREEHELKREEYELEKKGDKPILGVLPFASPSSAVLILAEMAKMSLTNYPFNKNFIEFSLKRLGTDFSSLQRKPTEECICNEQSIDLYALEVKRSKFWRLSTEG